jgi:hypothetical protein
MFDNFNKLTKNIFITKGWQCFSFMLNGGSMVKDLNLPKGGEGFKSWYLQPIFH